MVKVSAGLQAALHKIVENTPGNSHLPLGGARVLGFHGNDVLLIAVTRIDAKSANRTNDYLAGPYRKPIETVEKWISSLAIFIHKDSKSSLEQPDKDLLAAAKTKADRKRVLAAIARRSQRMQVIEPLVKDKKAGYRSALEMFTDPRLRAKIVARANSAKVSVPTVYNLLHRFWAGGCRRSAMFTGHARCGSPGKARTPIGSQGRKSRRYKAKLTPHRAYVLDRNRNDKDYDDAASDRQKLAWGWRLIRHRMTRREAYVVVMGAFWADHVKDKNGATKAILWEEHLRPTFNQFCYWGRKLNGGYLIAERLLSVGQRAQKTETHAGSEQDLVVEVGQLAGFDGTKTDVYLASRKQRLKKLPPMLRLILKDVRTGVIFGWYLGWDPASPATAIQAIVHGASSKVEECQNLGIKVSDDLIPIMLCRTYLADNGELKAEKVTEFEEQHQLSIIYTPTGQGQKKGGVESQHRTDHKKLDHKLPGTTRGKLRERGDKHPAIEGLFNAFEYRREFVEHVIRNNNEEVPHLRPTQMEISEPDVPPTRINIFNWLRRRQTSELPIDLASLRAFGLPDVDAVVRKNGVYPLFTVAGSKVVIPRFRFSSPELVKTGLLSEVKRTGKTISTQLKMSDADPDVAYLPTKGGLLELRCATRPERVHRTLSTADWRSNYEDQLLARDAGQAERDQQLFDVVQNRQAVESNAKAELRKEIKKLGKKPSESAVVANLERNLKEELALDAGQPAGLGLRSDAAVGVGAAPQPAKGGAREKAKPSTERASRTTPAAKGPSAADAERSDATGRSADASSAAALAMDALSLEDF